MGEDGMGDGSKQKGKTGVGERRRDSPPRLEWVRGRDGSG